ncbi:MAG TPA: ATP-binding protein [Oculatellaceae cyanobacterium]|jgi:signal transduction histidine kinase
MSVILETTTNQMEQYTKNINTVLSLKAEPVKVLLIDDQQIICEAVRRILSTEENIIFDYCSDPTQAIQKAIEVSPTVILQDLVMPDVDGLLLLRFFRANPKTREIPIIMLSTKEEANVKAEAFRYGANDYLVKLPDQVELIARIRYHSNAYSNLVQRNAAEKRLEERSKELSQALENLQQTQAQLIQTEKMSSLGQMVAGVAHEINNPVNFIYGNINHASDYIDDLLSLIKLYQERYPEPDREIQQLTKEIDLEFLVDDLSKLLSSMKIGTERIRQIVLTLRNFSRLDEAEMKAVNIHEGIDSTLVILQNRLKAKPDRPAVQIVKDYGELPQVECYAGQLNQVFMNIISNAIDALQESMSKLQETGQTPTITIRTKAIENNRVSISIKDNGPGIPKEVKSKLFDPFFTTKPVGEGTGLGLSISYQIVVDKHGGVLLCDSQPGEGTEFLIEIPRLMQIAKDESKVQQKLQIVQVSAA